MEQCKRMHNNQYLYIYNKCIWYIGKISQRIDKRAIAINYRIFRCLLFIGNGVLFVANIYKHVLYVGGVDNIKNK